MRSISTTFVFFLLVSFCITNCKETTKSDFSIIGNPSGIDASLPFLTEGADGSLYFSWVEKSDTVTRFFFSKKMDGDEWSKPAVIASGTNWFVNWADYPMVNVTGENRMMAHFLEKSSSGTYSYDVKLKTKYEDRWNKSFKLHNDSTFSEHGFVSYAFSAVDNNSHLFWLDGRNTTGHHSGAMTLRTAVFDQQYEKLSEEEIDNAVCDCCQTTAVMTENGPVVFYRNRSELEIRDIYYARLVKNQWTEPRPVFADNWLIEGCPVNGPRAYSMGKTVVIAWYTAANNKPSVKIAFSENNGESFQSPVVVDSNGPLGRVDVVLEDENTAVISWLASKNKAAALKVAKVHRSGEILRSKILNESSGSRGIGFPQLEKNQGKYYLAYTKDMDNTTLIEMARIAF